MREDGVRTTWISASQRTIPDPNGEKRAEIMAITPDGSKIFFTSCEKLTDNSTAVSNAEDNCISSDQTGTRLQGRDLYSYDVDTGELTDLTVDSNPGDALGAAVQGILGISNDGSDVYFAASGALAPGATPGKCRDGECNLYVSHDGVTTFIARIDRANNWEGSARVTPDGNAMLFGSNQSLTGYDNFSCGNVGALVYGCLEFFRYTLSDEKLLCVTCKPTGTLPSGEASLGDHVGGSFLTSPVGFVPGTRNLSADGSRVFFSSPDALVQGDTNGARDVYEWEEKGAGSCKSESQNGGCIYLISSGTDPEPSGLLSASRDGGHVFFFTEAQLVPTDQDHLYDVYDAGIGAGLAAQHRLAPPTCASTACQANPAPPADQTPASATFRGPGNAKARPKARKCPKGKRKVRSGGKVRCKKASKRHDNHGGAK
jgi:hypothetical protein